MILSDFAGQWRLNRQIVHANGTIAEFSGSAVWSPDASGLVYEETGVLKIPGQPGMQATRKYLWRDGLDVYFDDGRFFHNVPLDGTSAHHNCPPDDYRVTYDFAAWPHFSSRWLVTGPRKHFEMTSRYSR